MIGLDSLYIHSLRLNYKDVVIFLIESKFNNFLKKF